MPSNFDIAFDFLIRSNIEGELSNLKDDNGGLTKYGISKRSYPNLDIVNLTKDIAKEIYKNDWWDKEYDHINSQDVTNKIFITTINVGAIRAHSILQETLNELGSNLKIDGKFGPITLEAVNNVDDQVLLDKYKINLIKFYLEIDDERISKKLTSYLRGWIRRALI